MARRPDRRVRQTPTQPRLASVCPPIVRMPERLRRRPEPQGISLYLECCYLDRWDGANWLRVRRTTIGNGCSVEPDDSEVRTPRSRPKDSRVPRRENPPHEACVPLRLHIRWHSQTLQTARS